MIFVSDELDTTEVYMHTLGILVGIAIAVNVDGIGSRRMCDPSDGICVGPNG